MLNQLSFWQSLRLQLIRHLQNPGVLPHLLKAYAILRFQLQAPVNEVSQLTAAVAGETVVAPPDPILRQLLLSFLKGRTPGRELVGQHAHRPDVDGFVVGI